ncbi:Uncharacterised protein [Bordetella pertussis]|nr:Uncharacterised protein [Bordetella pertussis]CFW40734.1 Uncharacterised protein [Bordetella pertussis]
MAELSWAGTFRVETMSCASTRPSAERSGSHSTAFRRGTRRSMNSRACEMGSASGS